MRRAQNPDGGSQTRSPGRAERPARLASHARCAASRLFKVAHNWKKDGVLLPAASVRIFGAAPALSRRSGGLFRIAALAIRTDKTQGSSMNKWMMLTVLLMAGMPIYLLWQGDGVGAAIIGIPSFLIGAAILGCMRLLTAD